MGNTFEQDYDLSEGFIKDIAKLLVICKENKTDGVVLETEIEGKTLIIDIDFKILQEA